jgi:hypothetical protein
MNRFGYRFGRALIGRMIAFAAVALTTLLGGYGDDGIIARLLRTRSGHEKLFRDYVELCSEPNFARS